MRRIIACLSALAMAGVASATVISFPNGNFNSPSGGAGNWVEVGDGIGFNYPTSGGNPDGYGVIDGTPGGWGIWVGGADAPLSLESLGLMAGQTYTFVQDMKIFSGNNIGGLKIESWGPTGLLGTSGDMRPTSGSSNWVTYSFTYRIASAATGIKVVPLWGANSVVGFDNIGVLANTTLSASITSPSNNASVGSIFTIQATASVSPGGVTNVNFYAGNTLLGQSTVSPYNWLATDMVPGAYALTAVAQDSSGNSVTSSVVNVTVTNAPVPVIGACEPFNYPAGAFADSTPATGAGFTGNWAVGGGATMVGGLQYFNFPAGNYAFSQASLGQRDRVSLSVPLSSGTVYVGFLLNQGGDNGANANGLYLIGGNTSSLMIGYVAPVSAVSGSLGLGSIPTSSTVGTGFTDSGAGGLGGGLLSKSAAAWSYATNHLLVLKIDFNTSGNKDSLSLWIDPPAGTNSPGKAADATFNNYDVGTINGIGFNLAGGGQNVVFDEINVGTNYASVVGANVHPIIPTALEFAIAPCKQVSWSASNTNFYQPQKSDDNNNWADLGPLLNGSVVTSVNDISPAAYYRVLEMVPAISETVMDGGFEVDDGLGSAFYWTGFGSQPPTRILTDFHNGTACLSLYVTNTDAVANASEIQQNLSYAGGGPITGGNTYTFSFQAKQIGAGASYVQQYKVTWLDSGSAVVGAVGWTAFTGGSDAWKEITSGPALAPAAAVNALIQIRGNTGAVPKDLEAF